MTKRQMSTNDLQNITQKTKDRATRTPLKQRVYSGRPPLKQRVYSGRPPLKQSVLGVVLH